MLKIKEAIEELQNKSYNAIQTETAWKWSSRAAAAYEMLIKAEKHKKLAMWTMAEEYLHEGIEHAALCGEDAPKLVKEIQEAISSYQTKAFDDMEETFDQDLG